ncbi:MAG: hypothetical protein L6Q29_03865 [Candidatus Pacebacteria bacterium]|nr:hypothetical protein [Candidatus Paceibacterota bacterium]
MFAQIAYYKIIGVPVLMYFGFLAYFSLLFTASIATMNRRGINKIPFRWHPRMAITTIILTTVHVVLAMLAYLKI